MKPVQWEFQYHCVMELLHLVVAVVGIDAGPDLNAREILVIFGGSGPLGNEMSCDSMIDTDALVSECEGRFNMHC